MGQFKVGDFIRTGINKDILAKVTQEPIHPDDPYTVIDVSGRERVPSIEYMVPANEISPHEVIWVLQNEGKLRLETFIDGSYLFLNEEGDLYLHDGWDSCVKGYNLNLSSIFNNSWELYQLDNQFIKTRLRNIRDRLEEIGNELTCGVRGSEADGDIIKCVKDLTDILVDLEG